MRARLRDYEDIAAETLEDVRAEVDRLERETGARSDAATLPIARVLLAKLVLSLSMASMAFRPFRSD